METRPLCRRLLVLTLAALSLPAASAQSINQHAIQKQLKNKVIVLRGRYLCPSPWACKLVFNQQGQLKNKAVVGPFSLSAIYVRNVNFRGQKLVLHAYRAAILRINKSIPVQLSALLLAGQHLTIQIAMNTSQPTELQAALHAIFDYNIKQALNAEPRGQREADIASLPLLTPETKAQAKLELKKVGWPAKPALDITPKNGVTPPKLYYQPEPRFTDRAKIDHVQGICEFSLVVNAQGLPQNIRIIKTLPDGLDYRALVALSQYRFKPATKNGKPVAIRMLVEVDFHLT